MPIHTGHASGNVRRTFLDAIHEFYDWPEGECEPTVEFEVNSESQSITVSAACGPVWNCTDAVPVYYRNMLSDCGVETRGCTYAAAAQALRARVKNLLAASTSATDAAAT
ncbi:conserved protein of unknown function [Hyphomicrobium sp. 1Nfss2.1]|uniref:hypothetical protein n=1 Tax=Hyphomicrobium sp. 1Nfss2.1 TaxID=3413936 RepID=UPI003C7E5720